MNRKQAQQVYFEKIRERHAKGGLSTEPFSIKNSLLHMHCNRLLGTDPEMEKKARFSTRHCSHFAISAKNKAILFFPLGG